MTLLAWSEDLSAWKRDALRRIAVSDELTDEDRAAIRARLLQSAGIAVEGDVQCSPLSEAHLPADGAEEPPTILCGIGPVRHVDKLADNQELKFAVAGITLNFGDNGTGKSGYARVAKKLCAARVTEDLQGDVFAAQRPPSAEVRYRFRGPSDAEPEIGNWTDGDPRPEQLSRTMVLDSTSARVYVDGRNEITYLPREIEIVARLGKLCTALKEEVQREAEAIAPQHRGVYGDNYSADSSVGRLVRSLVLETALGALPSEADLRNASAWDEEAAQELANLEARLAENPAFRAATLRRIQRALEGVCGDLNRTATVLSDDAMGELSSALRRAKETEETASLSAQDRFRDEPIPGTGRGAWRALYDFAREFAAAGGVRAKADSFVEGDHCPFCQQEIDAAAAARLVRFDEFIRSRTAAAAAESAAALDAILHRVDALAIPDESAVKDVLSEFCAIGEGESALVGRVIEYLGALNLRKVTVLEADRAGHAPTVAVLPISPAEALEERAESLGRDAERFEAQPSHDVAEIARAAELRGRERLSRELDIVLARRAALEHRRRLLQCEGELDTRPISVCATRLRQELVTPRLKEAILDEVRLLDLGHLPFRFTEASERGRNFFDLTLDAPRGATKGRVMSEGEQRALGIACFFAEMKRVSGRHGIIVDDPVSSLDHQRLRKVAERLVAEAAAGRQVMIFTHHLVFYQEVIAAAAGRNPQVPVLPNLIAKKDGHFGVVSEDDEPWIAKKVTKRTEALRVRLASIPASVDPNTDEFRRAAKDFYSDLRETWERLVEEVLLCGVVERFNSAVKTQSLRELVVDDEDHQLIFAAMKRVSEFSGHDMAAGRQIPIPGVDDMRRDLDSIDAFRVRIHARKNETRDRRRAREEPPRGAVA